MLFNFTKGTCPNLACHRNSVSCVWDAETDLSTEKDLSIEKGSITEQSPLLIVGEYLTIDDVEAWLLFLSDSFLQFA